jgi:hypothetical protein
MTETEAEAAERKQAEAIFNVMSAVKVLIEQLGAIVATERAFALTEARAERNRAVATLRTLHDFVRGCRPGTASRAVDYLFSLAVAIDQLNDGVVHPMLLKDPPAGRPSDPHDIWEARMWFCLAVKCYDLSKKKTQEGAADDIAEDYADDLAKLQNAKAKSDGAKALKSWFKQIEGGGAVETVRNAWGQLVENLPRKAGELNRQGRRGSNDRSREGATGCD